MKSEKNEEQRKDTEWLLELSSNQRLGAFEVQDFIGNLRSMKEKMEAENRELQREWETMKNHRSGGEQAQLAPETSRTKSEDQDERNELETSRGSSGSLFLRSGTWDARSNEKNTQLQETKYSADEASIDMIEAQNAKLRLEYQSMQEQLASMDASESGNQELRESKHTWVSDSSADTRKSTPRSTNKYRIMLYQAAGQSITFEHGPPVSNYAENPYELTKSSIDGDSESFVDSSSSSSCGESAEYRSLRSIKYDPKNKSGSGSRKDEDEFLADLESLAESSYYSTSHSRNDSVDVKGETIEVVFSSQDIEEQKLRRYRARHSVFDKEDESRSGEKSHVSDFTSAASGRVGTKRGDPQQKIRTLGLEVEKLRGLTRTQEQEIERERQKQGTIIASLKEQMEKVVARECQLRKELAEARDKAHISESRLYGKEAFKNEHPEGQVKPSSDHKDYWLRQELEASQCQVKRQNQAIATLQKQLEGAAGNNSEEQELELQNALERVQVVEEENDELRGINQDLLQTKDLLVQMREAMEAQLDEHMESQDRLEDQLEEYQERIRQLRADVLDAREEADTVRKELEEAKKAYQDLGDARKKIYELEQEVETIKTKGEEDRERLLKQSLDNHKAKNLAYRQLEESMTRKRQLEEQFSNTNTELQQIKTTLDERNLRLEEVELSLSEHQKELGEALERTEELLKENGELRVLNNEIEEAMMNQSEEDRIALSDLRRQLKEAATGETILRQELDEAKAQAELYKAELEQSKEESAEQEQYLSRQLKSIQGLNKDLEEEKARLYTELSRVNEEGIEQRIKAEKFEKAFVISQQKKALLETNLSDTVAQLHAVKKVYHQNVREADDRIWQLEDVLDSQQSTIKRWKETARRHAADEGKTCGVPFL